MKRLCAAFCLASVVALTISSAAFAGPGGGWVTFVDQTAQRLVAEPGVGINDPDEKDMAKGDFDQDGDLDIIVVRKQPFTTTGRRRNVLFMFEGTADGHAIDGVFVDRTADYGTDASDGGNGLLDLTNDRDVVVTDVNMDGWLDFVTAVTLSDGLPKTISHPRVYINLGDDVNGDWLGFRYEEPRIPQFTAISGSPNATPRFCSVGAGDVTGDGFPELYFGDYDTGPTQEAIDVNDRLLLNDGSGFFTDTYTSRMTSQMLNSAFGVAAHIVDMNGDGLNDVLRDTALNAPRHISISYNDPNNVGHFNFYSVIYTQAPYHVTPGDLNNDGKLDLIVSDDGQDKYMINQGNNAQGHATFTTITFQGSDGNFGGNQRFADFNNDGLNDVIICDVDVDSPGCSRVAHMYRNLGNLPNVTLQEQGNPVPWVPLGIHDVEVLDINGDGWVDMFQGLCSGTRIWINQPPQSVNFSFPDGQPALLPPNTPTSFRWKVTAIGLTPASGTGRQFVSVDGGPFVETAMAEDEPNTYIVSLPGVPCTSTVRYYMTVQTTNAQTFSDPNGAPSSTYEALSAVGEEVILEDKFESPNPNWTITNEGGLTGGAWTRVDPIGTIWPIGSGLFAQPDNDFDSSPDVFCYVTQQYPGSGDARNNDVDNGTTILRSPVLDLDGADAVVSYARWHYSSDEQGSIVDPLVTEISNDGSNWTVVSSITGTNREWQVHSFTVSDYVVPTATVYVRFRTSDSPNNSVTESAIDTFRVFRTICENDCVDGGDCDDGAFCNGVETCVNNQCQSGVNPCPGQFCDEDADACVDCITNGDCDDGLFCNGSESCNDGECSSSGDPCAGLGLACDEAGDACVGCVDDAGCSDGVFCNGAERCIAGECEPAPAVTGVLNGAFDNGDSWSPDISQGGAITFGGNLNVTGPNAGAGGFTFASQTTVDLYGANLEFDLLSYQSSDTGTWDRPVFYVDGVFYGLNQNGTLGAEIPAPGQGDFGTINNDNETASPIHFSIDLEALVGAGAHQIGFGTMSADGQFGAGVSVFDNVLPASGTGLPCAGSACNEGTQTCEECAEDVDCDDGEFCNGAEVCMNGECQPGTPPCDNCDEDTDTCPIALQPAAGEPVLGLSQDLIDRFNAGKVKFDTVLQPAAGLGPIFNQNSCGACHNAGGLGGSGTILVTRFGEATKDGFNSLEQYGGSLLQSSGISLECQEVIPPEANVIAQRITNSTFGAGLVEAIPDADILVNATTPPPGVSGIAHMVLPAETPAGPQRVGRFGWKAQVATVLTFSGDASLMEMGLTNRLFEDENDPNGIRPPTLAECDTVADPEDGPEDGVPGNPHFIDRVTDFQRLLAPPPQTPKSGMAGEAIFTTIGCAKCHIPTFTTGAAPEAALSNKVIKPYSDFLLHDMGGLADGIEQGGGAETDMRTPSLWGVRLRDPMLHDGRAVGSTFAERVLAAISWHNSPGSEAAASALAFAELSSTDKDLVLAFLDSLGRREFDASGDNVVSEPDLAHFGSCYGPGPYTPDDACAVHDVDQDGDVDDDDFALFLTVYTGSQADCDGNEVNDALDIILGTAEDCDVNGIPDDCSPPTPVVSEFVNQLLADEPGPGALCVYDMDDNGLINGADIQGVVDLLLAP